MVIVKPAVCDSSCDAKFSHIGLSFHQMHLEPLNHQYINTEIQVPKAITNFIKKSRRKVHETKKAIKSFTYPFFQQFSSEHECPRCSTKFNQFNQSKSDTVLATRFGTEFVRKVNDQENLNFYPVILKSDSYVMQREEKAMASEHRNNATMPMPSMPMDAYPFPYCQCNENFKKLKKSRSGSRRQQNIGLSPFCKNYKWYLDASGQPHYYMPNNRPSLLKRICCCMSRQPKVMYLPCQCITSKLYNKQPTNESEAGTIPPTRRSTRSSIEVHSYHIKSNFADYEETEDDDECCCCCTCNVKHDTTACQTDGEPQFGQKAFATQTDKRRVKGHCKCCNKKCKNCARSHNNNINNNNNNFNYNDNHLKKNDGNSKHKSHRKTKIYKTAETSCNDQCINGPSAPQVMNAEIIYSNPIRDMRTIMLGSKSYSPLLLDPIFSSPLSGRKYNIAPKTVLASNPKIPSPMTTVPEPIDIRDELSDLDFNTKISQNMDLSNQKFLHTVRDDFSNDRIAKIFNIQKTPIQESFGEIFDLDSIHENGIGFDSSGINQKPLQPNTFRPKSSSDIHRASRVVRDILEKMKPPELPSQTPIMKTEESKSNDKEDPVLKPILKAASPHTYIKHNSLDKYKSSPCSDIGLKELLTKIGNKNDHIDSVSQTSILVNITTLDQDCSCSSSELTEDVPPLHKMPKMKKESEILRKCKAYKIIKAMHLKHKRDNNDYDSSDQSCDTK